MNAATNQPSILTLRLGQSDQAGQGNYSVFPGRGMPNVGGAQKSGDWGEGHVNLVIVTMVYGDDSFGNDDEFEVMVVNGINQGQDLSNISGAPVVLVVTDNSRYTSRGRSFFIAPDK